MRHAADRRNFYFHLLGILPILASFALTPPRNAAGQALPATEQVKDIKIPRIVRKPVIEEFLNGNSRQDMKRIDDFRQRQPGDGVPVSYQTSAWLGYDSNNLYVVFVCQSPRNEIRARMVKREDIFNEDWVAVILDSWHDHRRGYEFFVTPLGIQADALEGEGTNENFSFDTLWYSDGRLTPDGYIATFSLPFKSLRFNSEQVQTWGLALARRIPPKNETAFWPFISSRLNGFNRQFGDMNGMENISAGRNLQFIPYGAFGRSHFLDNPDPGTPAYRTKTDFRGGMDAKAVLRDTYTLDIALNPDFSQVESDDPQVTVNQRYEVQFPEKRPFFLDNSGFFATPEDLVFSRRIVDPSFGARLTGKVGRWSLGFLGMDDRAAGMDLDETDPRRNKRAGIAIARVSRELGAQSDIGLLVTSRDFAGSFNRVAAIDSRLKFGEHWGFAGQAITSATRDTDGERSYGNALNMGVYASSRAYYYELNYIDRGEGFNTDLGFIQRTGIRQLSQFARRTFRPESKVLLSLGPRLHMRGVLDRQGVQQDWSVTPGFQVEMARNTYLFFEYVQAFERYEGVNFRGGGTSFGGNTQFFRAATFDFSFTKGDGINYDTPEKMAPFVGDQDKVQARITLRPTSRLKVEEIYYFTRLKTRRDSFLGAPALPATVFTNHLARLRTNYQFNRRLSLRLILDYNAVLQNPSFTELERKKRIGGDVLLTYMLHPGTAFYIGYNDRLENLSLLPGSPPSVIRTAKPYTTTGRQFFMKISYLVRR